MTEYKTVLIKTIDQIDNELAAFFMDEAERVAALFGNKYNWKHFDFLSYAREGLFLVCYKNKRPVGVLLARLYGSIFDPDVKILMQDLIYTIDPGGRATYILYQDLIDFGKANANLIYTMISLKSNVKGRSLERLGFEKVEELYRMEI